MHYALEAANEELLLLVEKVCCFMLYIGVSMVSEACNAAAAVRKFKHKWH